MSEFQRKLQEFRSANRVNGKGALSVMLFVTREARNKGLPLSTDSLITKEHGQVKGLSKQSVQKILSDYGITQVLAQEGGRTSRGSLGIMGKYVEWLNAYYSRKVKELDLKMAEEFWINAVQEHFSGQPFKLHLDSSKSIASIIDDLMQQAEKRQKGSQGMMVQGALMQHLIGAKLSLVLPGKALTHFGFSVADVATSRAGDFSVEDVVIHVTTTPTESLLQKCQDNLSSNMRPVVVTTSAGVISGQNLAKAIGIENRVDFFEISQFVAMNVYEKGSFTFKGRTTTVKNLISRYNEIIEKCETDFTKLKIE